jgi:glycosyltransferase involved in cell wall biosynthesis
VRIAYVCQDRGIPVLGGKGASVHVREITTALQRRGHRVFLIGANLGAGNPPPPLEAVRMLEERADESEKALAEILRKERIEAVVERYALESGSARRVSESQQLPYVLEVNSPLVLEAARYRGLENVDSFLKAEARLFASAGAIGVVSRALETYVRERAPNVPLAVVRNGVDLQRFSAADGEPALELPPGAVPIGFVGSMKRWHGVEDLVSAFSYVAEKSPDAHLVLVGTGPEERAIGEQAAASRHAARIHLLGGRSHAEIPQLLRSFEIGAAPYRPSPDFYFCPLKILEYLGAGLPTVYPAIGDLPEIVGDSGAAYEPASIDSLAQTLLALLAEPARRSALRAAAVSRRAEFSWDRAAEGVERLVARASERAAEVQRL